MSCSVTPPGLATSEVTVDGVVVKTEPATFTVEPDDDDVAVDVDVDDVSGDDNIAEL